MKILLVISISILTFACSAQKQIRDLDGFKEIGWEEINDNTIKMIGKDWMLISAGNAEDYNMMTASWGTLGWLWERPVSTIYVRPQRHTHNYTEREEYYTITFYDDPDKEVLRLMGTVSGKNFDKMNYEKLTPVITPNGSIAFEEAKLIIECKKLYTHVLKDEEFNDTSSMNDMYPKKDFHTVYIGEITGVWMKK
ncbi:MAG: flavin reductase [Bacteroidales bacterium]|nr:flavin reductase [Bacteroidales bacterium]